MYFLKKIHSIFLFSISISLLTIFSGCIGDDIIFDNIEESVRITNPIMSIGIGQAYVFNASYFNNIGVEETATVLWESSVDSIASIQPNGVINAKAEGMTTIFAKVELSDKTVSDSILLAVTTDTMIIVSPMSRIGDLQTTSTYLLEGSFSLVDTGGELSLEFGEDFNASTALPGLYVYLTNNPSTNNGALEIAKITQFSGAHGYSVPSGVSLTTYDYVLFYCKPFSVKVGDGQFE